MLKNNLYKVLSFENENGKLSAQLLLDPNHEIFKGHFPQQPVLPGVCMMQMVKELMEDAVEKKLFLNDIAQTKFLSMVDPVKTPELLLTIDYSKPEDAFIAIKAVLKNTEATFFKMSGKAQVVKGTPGF